MTGSMSQVEEFKQLHTIVHAIGDSELIDSVINLHVTYTSFLGGSKGR